jgi:hypothetical protein
MFRTLLLAIAALAVAAPAFAQSVEQRRQAVETTLAQAPLCSKLGDLYWEIGNADDRLASGNRGRAVLPDRRVSLGSASKWLFAAYVAERRQGVLSPTDIAGLNMTSGYSRLNQVACRGAGKVGDCPADPANPEHMGRFYYNGGHAQRLAIDMGLGAMTPRQLAAEMRDVLDVPDLEFDQPQPGGGAVMTPAGYGTFLRRLVAGDLSLSPLLGRYSVCTLCLAGLYSPAPKFWNYSLGHWVENDRFDDGAFSSPGVFGFYPWISADRTTWGLLARNHLAKDAWYASAQCGALTRKAWVTAKPQQ